MAIFNRYFATRRRVKLALVAAGFIAGAIFGCALTVLGKIVAGAPPATFGNYVWNAAIFGVLAGVVSPLVTWSWLRRVPLWRTIVEPLTYAVLGGAVGVIAGSAALFLALPPAGLLLGFARLGRVYPKGPPPFWALPSQDRHSARTISNRSGD